MTDPSTEDLPPEPGSIEDHDLGIPGDPDALPGGDAENEDDAEDLDHEAYDDDDEDDELGGEVDSDARDDGLEEPEDDSEGDD